MITFDCSMCENLVNLPDRAAGRKTNCPHCSGIVQVPEEADEEDIELEPIPVRICFGSSLNWWLDWGVWVAIFSFPFLLGIIGFVWRQLP